MTTLPKAGKAAVYLVLFSDFWLRAIGYFTGTRENPLLGAVDEGLVLALAGLLLLKSATTLRFPPRFALWLPYLFLFVLSWAVNLSDPVLAANLLFSFLKPFILALGAINFLGLGDLKGIFRVYFVFALLQVPFLAYQVWTIGYVTGTAADDYVGFLNEAHHVAALAMVPSLWLLGRVYWHLRAGLPLPRRDLAWGLALFFILILCEAKLLYLGSVLGMAAYVLMVERMALLRFLPRFALLAVPLLALIVYFGMEYFATMEYAKLFELFQKLDAYFVTFAELPDMIPHAWLGAGPGTYGSAIAMKFLPPLADHFFGEAMRTLEVGGTFMTPFSELNGAIGELGYLGPFLLLLPYVGHLLLCVRRARILGDPFLSGAMFSAVAVLVLTLIGTVFLPALVQSQLTFPALVLSSLLLDRHEGRPA